MSDDLHREIMKANEDGTVLGQETFLFMTQQRNKYILDGRGENYANNVLLKTITTCLALFLSYMSASSKKDAPKFIGDKQVSEELLDSVMGEIHCAIEEIMKKHFEEGIIIRANLDFTKGGEDGFDGNNAKRN